MQPDTQHASLPVHPGPPLQAGCVHIPPTHESPAGHWCWHSPQLLGSVAGSEQPPGQHCADPLHAGPPAQPRQTLSTQVRPGAHAFPQKPQFCGSLVVSEQPAAQH